MNKANYTIEAQNSEYILIRDVGPHDHFMTVTNAAESVVAELADVLKGRRLFYIDSEGETAEIRIKDGRFAGFAFGMPGDEDPTPWCHICGSPTKAGCNCGPIAKNR